MTFSYTFPYCEKQFRYLILVCMFPIAGACAEFSCRPEIRRVAPLPFLYSVARFRDSIKEGRNYTTFTGRATGDWAEIWGDRTSSLYTSRYGKGWLLVNIVGYFMFKLSFSLFFCHYLLICHQSSLERAFLQNLRSILGLTADKNNVLHCDGLVS